eukprot:13753458-Ditylum_brightwellii.AAC.1
MVAAAMVAVAMVMAAMVAAATVAAATVAAATTAIQMAGRGGIMEELAAMCTFSTSFFSLLALPHK